MMIFIGAVKFFRVWSMAPLARIWCIDGTFSLLVLYLCIMKHKEVPNKYEFFASFFLPNGMLDWFDIVRIEEETNDGTKKFDGFFSTILHIYLDERDNREGETLGLVPNGFTEPTIIKDYPIRDRKVILHVRRRRYKDADGRSIILNHYPLKSDGTELSVEFGVFLKDDPR